MSTIIVPDDYSTIKEAVDNVVDGDTVIIRAGTYTENIPVTSTGISFTVMGSGDVTICPVTAVSIIGFDGVVGVSNILFTNFTLNASGVPTFGVSFINNCSNITISAVEIYGTIAGVYFNDTIDCLIDTCSISANMYGIVVGVPVGAASTTISGICISGSTISGNLTGYIQNTTNPNTLIINQLVDNTVTIFNIGSGGIVATNNWYGSYNGPAAGTIVNLSTAASVTYDPWIFSTSVQRVEGYRKWVLGYGRGENGLFAIGDNYF